MNSKKMDREGEARVPNTLLGSANVFESYSYDSVVSISDSHKQLHLQQ